MSHPCDVLRDRVDLAGSRVLVGCDDADVCDLLEILLGDAVNSPIERALDAASSLDAASQLPTALVLLSLRHPALALLASLREFKTGPLTRQIPVLVMSADPTVKSTALQAGADVFLAMPFDVEDLKVHACELIGRGQTSVLEQ